MDGYHNAHEDMEIKTKCHAHPRFTCRNCVHKVFMLDLLRPLILYKITLRAIDLLPLIG